MSPGSVGVEIVLALLRGSGEVAEVLEGMTGETRQELEARLERARSHVRDPIDTTAADVARRAELDRILRGRA